MTAADPAPGVSAEGRRLIDEFEAAVSDGVESGVSFTREQRDALSAHIAALEARVMAAENGERVLKQALDALLDDRGFTVERGSALHRIKQFGAALATQRDSTTGEPDGTA